MPYWRTFFHLIWATKDREQVIGTHEEAVIRRSFTKTFTELRLIPHAIGMIPDHIHVVVSIPPSIAVSEVLKRLKGASSHAVNQSQIDRNGSKFTWQPEYGVITFGERSLPQVVDYVLNQPAHHLASTLWPQFERIETEPVAIPHPDHG